MHIRELGHIVLSVRDLQASARFYGEVLGMRQVHHGWARGVLCR